MPATRNNAYINTPITLEYKFYQNNQITSPFNFQKFEIRRTNPDGTGSILVQATSTGIVQVSPGIFQYTMEATSTAGVYFDKVYIYPTSTAAVFTASNYFTVYEQSLEYSGNAPVALTTNCRIYGQILKPDGTPQIGSIVIANVAKFPVLLNGSQFSLAQDPIKGMTNQLGQFYLDVPKNCELYFAIPDINLKRYVKTPGTNSADLFSLTDLVEIGDATSNDTSPIAQDSW